MLFFHSLENIRRLPAFATGAEVTKSGLQADILPGLLGKRGHLLIRGRILYDDGGLAIDSQHFRLPLSLSA